MVVMRDAGRFRYFWTLGVAIPQAKWVGLSGLLGPWEPRVADFGVSVLFYWWGGWGKNCVPKSYF